MELRCPSCKALCLPGDLPFDFTSTKPQDVFTTCKFCLSPIYANRQVLVTYTLSFKPTAPQTLSAIKTKLADLNAILSSYQPPKAPKPHDPKEN